MSALGDRAERNKLRSIIMSAEEKDLISPEEVGFVVSLIERFRNDIEKKMKAMHMLQGEIGQLKTNEQVIVGLVESMISAAERDKARQEAMDRVRNRDAYEDTPESAEGTELEPEGPVEEILA